MVVAIDIKEILAQGILDLCEKQSLESLTIKQLLTYTKVGRQTFYNHFMDKNDLIQYIYLTRIIPDYHRYEGQLDFKASLIDSFERMRQYHCFMKQACMMEGQNCLKDFIFEHCQTFDLKWHQELYGKDPMPEALVFATKYHATASSSMTLSWILSDMPVSALEMAELITKMRAIGMDKLFEGGKTQGNPYLKS